MPENSSVFFGEMTVLFFGLLFLIAAIIEFRAKTDFKFLRNERIAALILGIVFFALSVMAVLPYYYHDWFVGKNIRYDNSSFPLILAGWGFLIIPLNYFLFFVGGYLFVSEMKHLSSNFPLILKRNQAIALLSFLIMILGIILGKESYWGLVSLLACIFLALPLIIFLLKRYGSIGLKFMLISIFLFIGVLFSVCSDYRDDTNAALSEKHQTVKTK
jgi:hypothetical protein